MKPFLGCGDESLAAERLKIFRRFGPESAARLECVISTSPTFTCRAFGSLLDEIALRRPSSDGLGDNEASELLQRNSFFLDQFAGGAIQ